MGGRENFGRRFSRSWLGAVCGTAVLAASGGTSLASAPEQILEVYDGDYAALYDRLWRDDERYAWEVREVRKHISPPAGAVRILDAGCGTGTHYALLSSDYYVLGLDISPEMIAEARRKNPQGHFRVGDLNNGNQFRKAAFSHIISLYNATFYNRDLERVFANYHKWLEPGGVLIFDFIDRNNIRENIGPRQDSQYFFKPGRRVALNLAAVTEYDDFVIQSWWELDEALPEAEYHEFIRFSNGREIKKEHVLFLPTVKELENMLERVGFRLKQKERLINDASEFLYVYERVGD